MSSEPSKFIGGQCCCLHRHAGHDCPFVYQGVGPGKAVHVPAGLCSFSLSLHSTGVSSRYFYDPMWLSSSPDLSS
ncbi:hypothetical protein CEXT_586301 [Caerostris extrusa]|uniref:Uncharacterized protein n=1 Tax=Caerostris extrusa TaxID=172846 RepID=A0AAV4WAS5_CAEEX|nr:hypothetical protein CEXT_586301 [Caerostris extrusa]